MSALVKLAAVVAANLAIWPVAWIVFEQPAGSGPIAIPRDAGRGDGSLAQPELGDVLDFSRLSPVQAYSRPLFDQDRRPWEPPAPLAPELEPEQVAIVQPEVEPIAAPMLRLVGISSSGAADMKALLQVEPFPEPVWVIVGDVLQGWEVGKIDPQSITIRRGAESLSFGLYPETRPVQ